ncbi:MAG: tRNA uridine-5-carboxymethylaminomethyl(34) synthesis GTPase MnmE [Rikenellaceae bacterium]
MNNDTIVALSTGHGGAIAVIRVSGDKAIAIIDGIFANSDKTPLDQRDANTTTYGEIVDTKGETIDQVVVALFKAPRSYTSEDIIEISCHASQYIIHKIIELILERGARMAEPGEFTQRAYLSGKLDLVQAEAVADIIASNSAASHRMAINQVKGGYSKEFKALRDDLLHLVSLLELELDFGEEDVEFADRESLRIILEKINTKLNSLISSFRQGNAMKNGIPTAIIGQPNAGKSTLLNALIGEERAIVSHIAGTTRDSIEECITIGGVMYRFIDTAGIRTTTDHVETLGIQRTFEKIKQADLIMVMVDATDTNSIQTLDTIEIDPSQKIVVIINKTDLVDSQTATNITSTIASKYGYPTFEISAKKGVGVTNITTYLDDEYSKLLGQEQLIISNLRQMDLLSKAFETSQNAYTLLTNNAPTDLIATESRQTITHLSSIIGDISTDNILENIFRNFCIGK